MEASNSDASSLVTSSPINEEGSSRILQFRSLRYLQSPISSLLEHAGVLRGRPDYPFSEAHPLIPQNSGTSTGNSRSPRASELTNGGGSGIDASDNNNNGEVSIRIIGEQNRLRAASSDENGVDGVGMGTDESMLEADDVNGNANGNGSRSDDSNREMSSYPRYEIQQVTRWAEQILPFSLLLLVVFIRQHLQGFFVTIYITAILYKSNDILKKQTALKGERKFSVLAGYSVFFMLQIFVVYWWYQKNDIFHPLIMIPPKAIPPFWHAIFVILVNDTMVREAAMVLKLFLLMYYRNSKGHNFRRQGQMLTLVEYALLLYRALLPAPVWYRFFLNKDYGSLFSSLTTGLYLTFKLTSIVEKVQSLITSLKALYRKEVHYGSHATLEQVDAAGDICAICQEKMHAPILLLCKHIFCEDCVSEWFERERTCPLCRALVRPADLRSYGDGSTSLFCQLF